jgi:hypothetical protein
VTSSSIELYQTGVDIVLTPDPPKWSYTSTRATPTLKIWCKGLDWQIYPVMKICDHIRTLRTSIEGLDIKCPDLWEKPFHLGYLSDNLNPAIWPQLFHSFPLVKRLKILDKLELAFAAVLRGSIKREASDIFPKLETIFIDGATSCRAGQRGIQ